jgi:hypothetical protein
MTMTHLFPNGNVEVGTGKPGYRWVPAYSQASDVGISNPLTRNHWRQIAARDGLKLRFHATQEAARDAIRERAIP